MDRRFGVALVMVLHCIAGCGSPSSASDALAEEIGRLAAPQAVIYSPGNAILVASATIGPDGGTLMGAPGSPVEGVVVTVPAGAVTSETTLSIGYDSGSFSNLNDRDHGPVIVLRSSGPTEFDQPLRVEFPFDDAERIPVPYYIADDGSLELVRPLPTDRGARRAGFLTWHVSNYTSVNDSSASPAPVRTLFDPKTDGFALNNTHAAKYVHGRCWGMVSFAQWYRSTIGPGLSEDYTFQVPTAASSVVGKVGPLVGQELIATRVHNAVAYYGQDDENQAADQDADHFIVTVLNALRITGRPVAIGLFDPAHAVLAVGATDHQIAVYDPNHPGLWKAIDYDRRRGPATVQYGNWRSMGVFRNGERRMKERIEHVMSDVDVRFHDENEAKIEVTSHTDGQKVSQSHVTLRGRVSSGQVLVEALEVTMAYGGAPVTFPITQDDPTFQFPVTLSEGDNVFEFTPFGYLAYLGVKPVDRAPRSFTLVYEPPACSADLSSDPNNCGACGNTCDPGLDCVDGQCACAGQTLCNGQCMPPGYACCLGANNMCPPGKDCCPASPTCPGGCSP